MICYMKRFCSIRHQRRPAGSYHQAADGIRSRQDPDAWPEGKISGLSARGGFKVDITWKAGKLYDAVISSKNGNSYKLVYGTQILEFSTEAGKSYRVNQDLKIRLGE